MSDLAEELAELRLRDYAPRAALRIASTDVPRSAVPAVDVHNHLGRWLTGDGGWMAPDVPALIAAMDAHNVATVVNLDGRPGELAANIERYDAAYPDRFVTFCQLDWGRLLEAGATERLVDDLRAAAGLGARGLKVWKDLGLSVVDAAGARVLPDDPRLSDVFAAAGELGLPVLIHVADPLAFFTPLDRHNERLEELLAVPAWWFGGAEHPSFDRLVDALEAVGASAPGTTFIGAHVGCAAEDLDRVDAMMTAYPNFHVDIAGRVAEIGRQPRRFRRLALDHPDRVLFGTDSFPLDPVALTTLFRFLETDDEHFPYAPDCETPPTGRWAISGAHLPTDVLAAVYAGNARRLLDLP